MFDRNYLIKFMNNLSYVWFYLLEGSGIYILFSIVFIFKVGLKVFVRLFFVVKGGKYSFLKREIIKL